MTLSPSAEDGLLRYPWPGNIRELENVIHHALLVCRDTVVRREDLQLARPHVDRSTGSPTTSDVSEQLHDVLVKLFEETRPDLYQHIDAAIIRSAFHYCERNQVRTARLLGISRNIIRDRLARYGLLKSAT